MGKLNSAKINLGIIDPTMFLVNPGNEYPIILIDYMLNNIIREGKLNNEEDDPCRRISKFYPESFDNIFSNTHLAVLFLTKCFLEDKRQEFSYEKILVKFVKEFWSDSKIQLPSDNNQNQEENEVTPSPHDSEKPIEFKDLIKDKIRNHAVKKLLIKYLPQKGKDHILINSDNFSKFLRDFYELVFKPNLANYKCNECLSPVEKINLKFNDILCNNCLNKNPFKDTRLNEFIKNFNFVAESRKRIIKMKKIIEELKFTKKDSKENVIIPQQEDENQHIEKENKHLLMLNEDFEKVDRRNIDLERLATVKKQYLISIITSDLYSKKKQINEKVKLLQDKLKENKERCSFENKMELDEIIKYLDETLLREKTKWEIIAGKICQGTGFVKEYDPMLIFCKKLDEYKKLIENLQGTILKKIYDDSQLFSDTPKFLK
jgi:hypothetical protein